MQANSGAENIYGISDEDLLWMMDGVISQSSAAVPPPPDSVSLPDGKRFWAVIVGIDHYEQGLPGLPDLLGACADAIDMYTYLRQTLGVPDANIRLLLSPRSEDSGPHGYNSQEPTYDTIWSALSDQLMENPLVQDGDNVLLFFAGYGSEVPYAWQRMVSPDPERITWENAVLCPSDRGSPRNGSPGEVIHDIRIAELHCFFAKLHSEKNVKTTIIPDCGYNDACIRTADAGFARSVSPLSAEDWPPDPAYVEQGELVLDDAPYALLSPIPPSGMMYGEDSHCWLGTIYHSGEGEEIRGIFTRELLICLRKLGSHEAKTYVEVCEDVFRAVMPPKNTASIFLNPYVVGRRKTCYMWREVLVSTQ